MPAPQELIDLSHRLGKPERELVILAEGNTSCKAGETFWVKASGHQMANISADGFVECHSTPLIEALDRNLADLEVHDLLLECRVGSGSKPSVEAFMHAWLLSLPGIEWVGHVHSTAALSILCSASAKGVAQKRYFPDEVVCCGVATAWVPYVDPGLQLAREIRDSVTEFVKRHEEAPKMIWLQSHGTIAIGKSPNEVEAGLLMNDKMCRAFNQNATSMQPLDEESVARIHSRPDEHYRQNLLWQLSNKS